MQDSTPSLDEDIQNSAHLTDSSRSRPRGNSTASTANSNLPKLRRGSQHEMLYVDWGASESDLELPLDYYDNDDGDDISDAASDFTDDYSRHKFQNFGRDPPALDDESSLSSNGSYDEDYWSTDDASSRAGKLKGYEAGGIQGELLAHYSGHLLDASHTDFSVEEDPLFNASSTLKMFDAPSSPPAVVLEMKPTHEEIWSDEEEEEHVPSHQSWSTSRIWRETSDGGWIPKGASSGSQQDKVPPQLLGTGSVHSAVSIESVDSFAGEHSPPRPRRKQQPKRQTKQQIKRDPPSNLAPLQPDPNLRVDSDEEEPQTIENVLHFSDEEETPHKTAPAPTDSDGVAEPPSPNPIVHVERETTSGILNQLSPPLQTQDNVQPQSPDQEAMEYSKDWIRPNISVLEFMGPLKDHSKVPKRSKSRSVIVKNRKKKKSHRKSKKHKHKSSKSTTEQDETDTESVVSATSDTEQDSMADDESSVASDASNDSMDAADVKRSSRRKKKKKEKKKKKKNRPKKRGRRADFESPSEHEGTVVAATTTDASEDVTGVAGRVEAIFNNRQVIFESSLHPEDADRKLAAKEEEDPTPKKTKTKREGKATKSGKKSDDQDGKRRRSSSVGSVQDLSAIAQDGGVSETEAKPGSTRIRSKAADESKGKSTDRGVSRSKSSAARIPSKASRSRSKSREPSSTKNRSRSKSKDYVSNKSQSRSKYRARSKSKDRARSKSPHSSKARDAQPGALRRKLKKDKVDTEELNDSASLFTSQTEPANEATGDLGRMLARDAAVNYDNNTPLYDCESIFTTQTAPAGPVRENGEKDGTGTKKRVEKRKSYRQPKSSKEVPATPETKKGTKKIVSKSSPSKSGRRKDTRRIHDKSSDDSVELVPRKPAHAMTLQDVIDRGLSSDDDSDLLGEDSDEGDSSPGDGDPSGETRHQIERMERKIQALEQQTKDDIAAMKKALLEDMTALTKKVLLIDDRYDGIMFLHKEIVNDHHKKGRQLKKLIKGLKSDISREVALGVELMEESHDMATKTQQVLLDIERLRREQTRHMQALDKVQTEYQEMVELRSSDPMGSNIMGNLDFDVPTMIPWYTKWRKPEPRRISDEVLFQTYNVSKDSIFYNVLKDNDYKLVFSGGKTKEAEVGKVRTMSGRK